MAGFEPATHDLEVSVLYATGPSCFARPARECSLRVQSRLCAVPLESGLRPRPARSCSGRVLLDSAICRQEEVTRTYATSSYDLLDTDTKPRLRKVSCAPCQGTDLYSEVGSRTPFPCGNSVQRSSCKVRHWQYLLSLRERAKTGRHWARHFTDDEPVFFTTQAKQKCI